MRAPAWHGNWHQRIRARLRDKGFGTVTDFVDSQPHISLVTLARQISQDRDIAAVQLQWILLREAEETGSIERCARDLLVRELHENIPEGWRTTWDGSPGASGTRLISACTAVYTALPERFAAAFDRVEDALWEASIPEEWLPDGPDDPILLKLFRYWNEPE